MKKTAYSFNQNNFPILKEVIEGAINSDTAATASSCHTGNLASNKGLEDITTSSEIAISQGEVSNVLCSETASDGGHTTTPTDPHLAQREPPPRETNTLTLDISSTDNVPDMSTAHDDTVSLVSDGEHGHRILCSLGTTIHYDPAPISLGGELQELHSSSEDLTDCTCAAAGMREGISTPLSSIEEDGLVFNEMH